MIIERTIIKKEEISLNRMLFLAISLEGVVGVLTVFIYLGIPCCFSYLKNYTLTLQEGQDGMFTIIFYLK